MAKKRMFDSTVILCDNFLKMPHSAMSLYFMLCLTSNDNGFNSAPEDLMKRTRTSSEDLRLLYERGFVIVLDDGVLVVRHWLLHNYIKKDRYNDTWAGYDDMERITISDSGTYELVEIGSNEPSLRKLIELNGNQFVSLKEAKKIKEQYKIYPELENSRFQNGTTDKSESRLDEVRIEREEAGTEPVLSKDNFYGSKENVLLFPDELKEIYAKFENPKDLIDKVGYIFLNSKKRYDSHYAFLMKIALEDKWPLKKKKTETEFERLEKERFSKLEIFAKEKNISLEEAEYVLREENAQITQEEIKKIKERFGVGK